MPLAIVATVLFVALTFETTPSDPAIPDPHEIPPRDEAANTQDLNRFLVEGAGGGDGHFHTFRAGDLTDLVAAPKPESPRQLSLLDSGADPEAARRFLHQIPYGTAIALAAERHHVDALLLAAIVAVESGFSAHAVSPQGARGLMQILPDVAQDYGETGDLLDPYVNVEVGSRFVSGLLKDYKGDVEQALAAYNAGPGVVDRYKGVPPYPETRGYIREVIAQYKRYNRRAGIDRSREVARSAARQTGISPRQSDTLTR
jgi:soluble lytic murein transglycosylase-like protein